MLTPECAGTAAAQAEAPGRVSSVLNSKITGQSIAALPANLTLSSHGPLDHPDVLEGGDDDRGQDDATPELGQAAFPSPQVTPSPPGWTGMSNVAV